MKIAIPTIGALLDEYLTSCEVFTIFITDKDKRIVSSEILCTPQGCDCKCDIAYMLQQKGIEAMLVGEIGQKEIGILKQHGIKVYKGFSGAVKDIVETFLQRIIEDAGKNVPKRRRGESADRN